MIRIGKLTDYSMLILSHMAKAPDTVLSATSLAEHLHLSAHTVSKILKILNDANLVNSIRGAEGGYHLARDADKITVADVIAAMEGGISMTECCDSKPLCTIDSFCTMRSNWRKINKMVHALLTQYTIVDMTRPITGWLDGK